MNNVRGGSGMIGEGCLAWRGFALCRLVRLCLKEKNWVDEAKQLCMRPCG